MIKLIYSTTKNGFIGKNGKLLYRIPEDITRFRNLTTDHIVIMGRKTYEDIPLNFRPFKNRINVILSRNEEYYQPGCLVYSSLSQAIQNLKLKYPEKDIWIIGGEALFKEGIQLADEIYTTVIHAYRIGDAKAPVINQDAWETALSSEMKKHYVDKESFVEYQFINLKRKRDEQDPCKKQACYETSHSV